MRLRASLRWLLAAAALLALALVLGADALLRAVLESELRQRLGSAVSLCGISTELLGSPPRVTLRDLVIGPPGHPLLSLGTLGVEASSLAALRDGRLDALHLRFERIHREHAEIERHAD